MFFKKKLLLYFFIFNLIFSVAHEVFVKPVGKIMLYNNLDLNELNPFIYFTKRIYLDENSILKIIEEYDYTNGFYNDIFKVIVADGPSKGEIGYIYEDQVYFYKYKTKQCVFFFKNDYILDDFNLIIKKNTKAFLVDNYLVSGFEVLKLKVVDDKEYFVTISEKKYLQIILNENQEINYYLKNKAKVLKVIETSTLLPISNATCEQQKSDSNGTIYLYNFNKDVVIIEKEGFSMGVVELKANENISLAFLLPVQRIKYFDGRETLYENDNYKIIIDARNFGCGNEISFAPLNLNDLSIFAFPEIEEKIKIVGGFYIYEIGENLKVTLELKNFYEDLFFIYYDIKKLKWERVGKKNFFNKNQLELKNGYYIIAQNKEEENNLKHIIFDEEIMVKKYVRNRKGDYYKVVKLDEKSVLLPNDDYEIIYFNSKESSLTQIFYKGEKKVYFLSTKGSSKIFPDTFNGLWERKLVKGKYISQDSLEALGDMIIDKDGRILFKSRNFLITGNYELIDEKRIKIYIRNINVPVKILNDGEIIKVNSSIFNSQLVIYGNYNYYTGVFELSFDNIYLERIMKFEFENKKSRVINLESEIFYNSNFPEKERGKYRIYFVKK